MEYLPPMGYLLKCGFKRIKITNAGCAAIKINIMERIFGMFIKVDLTSDLSLNASFRDETKGTVIFEETHFTGVFGRLRDPEYFHRVFFKNGETAYYDCSSLLGFGVFQE